MTQPPGPDAIPPAPFPAVPPNHSSQVPIPPNPVWIQPKEQVKKILGTAVRARALTGTNASQ
jgi:hypothetical protein